jgi:D-threo-aldose 1-dehydrogenase
MDPLARRRLGRTRIEVGQLGFGGAGLGDFFEAVPESRAATALQAAWDAVIRYHDTAPWYGLTRSEHRFGRALYRQPRRDFVLSTKIGRTMHAMHNAETLAAAFGPADCRSGYGSTTGMTRRCACSRTVCNGSDCRA